MEKRKGVQIQAMWAIFVLVMAIAFFQSDCAAEYDYQQGGRYTPMGAIAAGGENGEIPPYEGGEGLKCPQGWEPGDFQPHPRPDEKPLFRIDHTNMEKYKDRLSPGQMEWLRKVPERFMSIYPSHRNFEFPDFFYKACEKTNKTARVDKNKILYDYKGGMPFLFPKKGSEMAYNLKMAGSGAPDVYMDSCRRVVTPSLRIRKYITRDKVMQMGEMRLKGAGEEIPNPNGYLKYILTYVLYPPDQKGEATLVYQFYDDSKRIVVWQYVPSLRRVKRAPSFDMGNTVSGGEHQGDEGHGGFVGQVTSWDWELLPEKKAMYIPAGNYDVWQLNAKDKEECRSGTPNPERFRYEMHRCWVLVATPAEGYKHVYSKRVYYIDEDTMFHSLQDNYDKRGNLWRHLEIYNEHDMCSKYRLVYGYTAVNLESLRYELYGGCRDENTKISAADVGMKESEFTVQYLRKIGR